MCLCVHLCLGAFIFALRYANRVPFLTWEPYSNFTIAGQLWFSRINLKHRQKRECPSDILANELIFPSDSNCYSVEGSGHSVDSTASQTLIPEESERASNEDRSWSGVTLTLVRAVHHSGPQDQGVDKVNTWITRHNLSIVRTISEEEGSRITTEEQLKKSHTSTVNADFLDSKSI